MSIENAEELTMQKMRVSISVGNANAEFSGSPEVVIQSVNNFISKQVPEIDLARKLAMNFSTSDLVDKFKDFVKITPEGPRIWYQERKLSDKEIVGLQLVAQRIASETRENTPSSVTLAQLQESTGLNPKSLSSRLSEMTKAGYVQRESSDEKTLFKMTTVGVEWLSTLLGRKQ